MYYIRLRNLWVPSFLNCWLARSAFDALLTSIRVSINQYAYPLKMNCQIQIKFVRCLTRWSVHSSGFGNGVFRYRNENILVSSDV